MRGYLLDTNVLLWSLAGDPRLPGPWRDALTQGTVHVSPVSLWEVETKVSIGKLTVPEDFARAVARAGYLELPLTWAHTAALRGLPLHHRDPFDRMLIAQALAEDLTLVSSDRAFAAHPVRLLA